jgi:hypothetical protein
MAQGQVVEQAGAGALAESNTVGMFERLAKDPNVPVDKLERLVSLQERVMAKNAEAEFHAALSEMQAELPTIGERGGIKDRAGNVQSSYALWEDVNRAILPILKKHGFSLTFRQESKENAICVTGVLAHRNGHSERTSITLPADTSGSKNAVQAVGSSVSYGKRYTAGMLLNLTSCGEDDDGKRAGVGPAVSDDQIANINALLDECTPSRPNEEARKQARAKTEAHFLKYLGGVGKIALANVASIPAKMYEDAIAALNQQRRGAK